jgi:3-hydroxypropionate dehydrogenase (NADP+)
MSKDIKSVACIGVGTIGHSWATLFAIKGYKVNVYDLSSELLKTAMERIKYSAEFLAEKGIIAQEDVNNALSRIEIISNMTDCVKETDYIQESTFESYEVKSKVFSEIDKANDSAIIASSTSGLLMTKIQKAAKRPERCIVAHPWNPPLLLKLVELVPGERTSEETVQITYNFIENLDKIPVIVRKEVPGFIGNRLQAALWREALSLVNNGVATVEDIDKACWAGPGARWAIMGPFLTLHLGGGPKGLEYHIDTIQHGFNEYWKSMDDWKEMPYHAAKKGIKGVDELEIVKKKTFEEMVKWRDDKLAKILRIQE